MTVSLSIIVPTLGRATLARTLEQLAAQVTPADEVIVVADPAGDEELARVTYHDVAYGPDWERPWFPTWKYLVEPSDGAGIGTGQRTRGMEAATGTHLAFIDDDDVHAPGALELMREAVETISNAPVVFRMRTTFAGTLWRDPVLRYGNVGTPMFVVPNQPSHLGRWEAHTDDGHGADYTFITGCVEQMGEPVWRPEIVAHIPHPSSRAA